MRGGQLCMSTIAAPHTMLAVKVLQSTAEVLPLATPPTSILSHKQGVQRFQRVEFTPR